MPSPASRGTNQFRCNACGRYFDTQEELGTHEIECAALEEAAETGRRELEREDHAHHEPNGGETRHERFKHGAGEPVGGR